MEVIILEKLFGKRLNELKKGSGLTYKQIAEELGLVRSTVCKYAKGDITNVTLNMVVKIADFFQVSPSWLAGWTDDKYYNVKK